MRFMIVDDDEVIRTMLSDIIEDYDLGEIAGEADNGSLIDTALLERKKIDILVIDMLMPIRDGVQTVKSIKADFTGKIIMLSQVENKEMIGNAYSLGVDYYITKPINRNEVVSVIRAVSEHMQLKNLVHNIEKNLHTALRSNHSAEIANTIRHTPLPLTIRQKGEMMLTEMGIGGEKGCKDLLDILQFLQKQEQETLMQKDFPSLKIIFTKIAEAKLGQENTIEIQKEYKALEQRLRRTIFQALVNLASMGIIDYANPKFEEYAAKFFDFTEVRKIMLTLESNEKVNMSQIHINSKKFIKVLFMEAKKD
ncbi:response regulator [Propionispira raffinosivorans]|uniref:response regulator n=1 Tax=Propionispira raffinosivorans TaxID=86959 RepID=UPI000371A94A|nr:response regulator [Propionispira raffinosivorans]